jgi:hypothetical protein
MLDSPINYPMYLGLPLDMKMKQGFVKKLIVSKGNNIKSIANFSW